MRGKTNLFWRTVLVISLLAIIVIAHILINIHVLKRNELYIIASMIAWIFVYAAYLLWVVAYLTHHYEKYNNTDPDGLDAIEAEINERSGKNK